MRYVLAFSGAVLCIATLVCIVRAAIGARKSDEQDLPRQLRIIHNVVPHEWR